VKKPPNSSFVRVGVFVGFEKLKFCAETREAEKNNTTNRKYM